MADTIKCPRIGINSLAEYTSGVTATRRTSIIKNAKEKKNYIVRRYNEAEEFLAHYISSEANAQILFDQIKTLRTNQYFKDSERDNAIHSANALEAFYKNGVSFSNLLLKYKVDATVNVNTHKTIIEGVKVSLRPELILRDKQSGQQLGFVKFYFSKTKALSKSQAEMIACFGKYYFESEHNLILKPDNCFVFDVFIGEFTHAPRAYAKRLSDIKSSCREIRDRWDLII